MTKFALMGAGALGSQIAMLIARRNDEVLVCDDDRVGTENVTTTVYADRHVGSLKAHVLCEMLWRKCGAKGTPWIKTLERTLPIIQWFPDLVIDTFDNAASRTLTQSVHLDTVHAGVSADRIGAVTWDVRWEPRPGPERGHNPVCTHELGRPILRLTAAIAANMVDLFLATGRKVDKVVSADLRVVV